MLFLGVPVAMAVFFGLYPLFSVLLGFTVLAMVLLGRTPGFSAGELLHGPVFGQLRLILVFALGCAALTLGLAACWCPSGCSRCRSGGLACG